MASIEAKLDMHPYNEPGEVMKIETYQLLDGGFYELTEVEILVCRIEMQDQFADHLCVCLRLKYMPLLLLQSNAYIICMWQHHLDLY